MHIPGWQLGLSVMDTPGPTWLYMITQESGLTRAKVSLMPFSALLESLTRVFNVACLISHFVARGYTTASCTQGRTSPSSGHEGSFRSKFGFPKQLPN